MGPNIETKEVIVTHVNLDPQEVNQERVQYLLERLNNNELTPAEIVELSNIDNQLHDEDDEDTFLEQNILTQFFERFPYALNGTLDYTRQDFLDASIQLRLFRTVDLHEGTISLHTILDIINS